ncbi:efflux transporter outer membrane subunit [Burkholderia sp. SIMBA_043]|uniref:efflux transporter outer membrane subunit n=1 Tax=Burkholderia TaxID=32008 RepID=UPI0005A07018|nr:MULTISPECIES: efflux transporter outer membrane subunit [Burkholderia]AJY08936.1 efflux transporter, outer membrane factor (OMF) lipo, NodT family protein [Burkholderia vietnamiensis LMG 10929]AVR14051.1 RND transporter [Burkholderia vietnamiensis]KVE61273.1 RND transporter [Burkholderia vietnamiensis]KVF66087.1 RND transporter [Burkholderia vietnamiensis]KVM46351.1 RND transporter [Burkholderia vietnamiensis]
MCTSPANDRACGGRTSRRRTAARLAAGLLAALLAGGCTVGPNFVPPPAPRVERFVAPDDPHAASGPWTGDGRTQALSPDAPLTRDWWTRFGSHAIDASVDAALTGSPTLALAEATLRRSEHALRAGQGVFFPQIDAQAGAARERATPSRGPALPASIFNLFTLSATVSYTLDLWGGERRQVEALAAGVDAQRHALAGAYLMLSANVVNTMIARAAYRDEAAATRETIGLVDEQIRLTRAQVTAGAAAYVAVLTLESQRATLQATLPALDQKRAQADDLLALLAGRYPADWRTPELSLAAIELPASLPDTAPSSLVRRRPDIQQAEAELHVASAQVGVATAALYPNLTLSASGGFDSGVAANLFSPAGRAWSVGAGVTAPLFHGGTLLNQRRAAQDAYDEADASYRQVVLAAFSQVADALRALANDAAALDAQARAMAAARDALRLTQAGYDAGITGYVPLLVADVQYHQARIAWLQALAQRLQDTVAFYVALGGGWGEAG